MYELINTSVPNGLIAGTHGFATVAMTKGMPDAIRQRVENFCAYPHRTSAHDASYFTENPVNWFHLMLPGGDHVVGRTAPAEFDYTGRTNRISHTLCFSAREMPINGGAYVLATEATRFAEGWSGEPRFLPSDKTTAGRLQLDNRPSGTDPTHWIQMFGADGKAYAQKFAALLEQNMRTSKGIYFKASKADNDGKRLLGLFADLINILPDGLAAQVTFSTFAACVPNGVACHLRGIYDKDRAFETASALQPWVDCENCCVKHPELLPDERDRSNINVSLIADNTLRTARSVEGLMPKQRTHGNASDALVTILNRRTAAPRNDPRFGKIGICITVVVCVVIAAFVCIFSDGIVHCINHSDDPLAIAARKDKKRQITEQETQRLREQRIIENEKKLTRWGKEQGHIIKDIHDKLRECADSNSISALIKSTENIMANLELSLKDNGCTDYGYHLAKFSAQYSALKKELDKERKAREKSERKEADRFEKAQAAQAEKDEKMRQQIALANLPLKDLTITDVLMTPKNWVERLTENEKAKLTNSMDVVFWYWNGTKCCQSKSMFTMPLKGKLIDPAHPEKGRVKKPVHPVEPKDNKSQWLVVYLPRIQRVFWQWKIRDDEVKLFEKNDIYKLADFVFGGENDGAKLYRKTQDLIFVLVWNGAEGRYRHFYSQTDLRVERYRPDQKRVDNKLSKLNEMIEQQSNALTNRIKQLSEISDSEAKLISYTVKHSELKDQRKKADEKNDKDKKKSIDEKIRENEKEAAGEFSKYTQFKSKIKKDSKDPKASYVDLKSVTVEEVQKVMKSIRTNINDDIGRVKKSIAEMQKQVGEWERTRKDWLGTVRKYLFIIDVITEGELPEDLPSKVKNRFKMQRVIDYVKVPSGVGEE